MNVLVYSGPEIVQTSVNQAISVLRSVLLPNYVVQPISHQILSSQPWKSNCALLVLPYTRNRFSKTVNNQIKDYVENGGAYLALGASASLGSRSDMGIGIGHLSFGIARDADQMDLPLKFVDKEHNRSLVFDQGDEEAQGAPKPGLVKIKLEGGEVVGGIFNSGIARLRGFDDAKGVTELGRYEGVVGDEGVAGVAMNINGGKVGLWSASIEQAPDQPPVQLENSELTPELLTSSKDARKDIFKRTLTRLGLQLPSDEEKKQIITRPLPQFFTSTPSKPHLVRYIMDVIASPKSGDQLSVLADNNDEFHFHLLKESTEVAKAARQEALATEPTDPATWQPKHIVLCHDGVLPDPSLTPLFSIKDFYAHLETVRGKEGLPAGSEDNWGIGEALLYGEAVTSTQTMFEKNSIILTQSPTPLVSLASFQLAGRGRGTNAWLSPAGSLPISVLLRLPFKPSSTAAPISIPANKLVLLQYLYALAVVEGCRDDAILGKEAGDKVRLKWPNDIYATFGPEKENWKKLGGVLVNTSFTGGRVEVIIGCGVNVLNAPPIASLAQLQSADRPPLSLERTAATILAKFESMWRTFLAAGGSFEPFMDLYLKRWLHTDQVVTLTTTTPHVNVRIQGITPDHGLLRTVPERGEPSMGSGLSSYLLAGNAGEGYIDLQPDGNSFDLMTNMIKSKS
ncbi:hypothetical protein BJ165DRAFT_1528358 [Panaeolus papilionaceus]|nr:hypothetical protein BJ165DRAFT_1528358 [Panaeolus papilionaceus]